MNTQSFAADRLDALHRRAGSLAHDFNHMLTVIMGATEQLAAEADPDSVERELAEIALRAADRGAELLRRMLDVTGEAEALSVEVVTDCAAAAASIAGLARHAAPQSVTIVAPAPGAPLLAAVDRGALEAAVMNLCINAAKAMPLGGTLEIGVEAQTLDAAEAAALGLEASDYATVTVRDDGCGMSPEVLANATRPLFTTRAGAGGTGLGLASVADFCREAGGALELISAEGAGTTAVIRLPRGGRMAPTLRLAA